MAKVHQILLTYVIIAASMVNSQDYDDSYSSWLRPSYYRPYYGNYYSTPPSSYDYENSESRNDYVDQVDPNRELTGEELWESLSDEEKNKIWPLDTIKLAPDFSCYEGLRTGPHSGNEYAKASIEFCEENSHINWHHCYNGCILFRRFNIMTYRNPNMNDISAIVSYLRADIFPWNDYRKTDDQAYEIAKRIKDNCDQVAKDLEGHPCNSKAALYECIQNAWGCN